MMKNWKKKLKMQKNKLLTATVALTMLVTPASAAGFGDSEIAKGIKNMVNDVSSYLVVLCPLAGGAAAVYFIIRRSMADEQDGKMWDKRIKTAIICGVAGMLVSGIIAVVSSYF